MDRIEVRIIVVLDSCVDGTAAVVDQHAAVKQRDAARGKVGCARAFACASCSTPAQPSQPALVGQHRR